MTAASAGDYSARVEMREESPPLRSERRDGVLVLTFDRPAQRNALSTTLIAALTEAIDAAGRDASLRVVLIAASGPAFCAGHDLRELTARRADPDGGADFFRTTMMACAAMMQAIVACPKPVIAVVEGMATAAGCQLVATCDLAVACADARFATPGVNIGLFCSTPMVALTRNVPRKQAMEMLLLGEAMTAEAALTYGLVNRVVPPGQALDTAATMAATIVAKSPLTAAIGKVAFYRQLEMPLADAYAEMAEIMVRNMLTHDAAEGIGAFIDRREPRFQGR